MADPLSLVASIIAVAGAAESIGNTLSRIKLLRSAPDELLALNTEVADLTVTLRNVESCVNASNTATPVSQPQDALQHLSTLINRAQEQLLKLDQSIHYQFLKSGSFDTGNHRVFRARWVRAKPSVEGHRQALRDIRQNIMTQMLVINSSHQSRIRLIVDKIFVISNQIQTDQLRDNDLANAVQQLSSRLEPLTNLQTNRNHRIGENTDRSQPSGNGLGFQHTSYPQFVPQQSRITSPRSPQGISAIGIRTLIPNHQQPPCPLSCRCKCHRQRLIQSSPFFDNVLGALFVGYSGLPYLFTHQACSETTCKSISGFRARIIYTFPVWLLSRLLDVHIAASQCHEPRLSITVRAVVPKSAELFRLCRLDDDHGLQHLFSTGLARPNDLSYGDENNALVDSIHNGSHKAIEVLLKAGTDPHYESPILRGSAYHRAMDIIFSSSGDPITLEVLRKNFPYNDELVEEYQFSKIHKIVLRLTSFSLLEQVVTQSAQRGQIDQVDAHGRTALSWAVQRQDANAVDLLLKANANPRFLSNRKCSPLAFAAFSGNLICIELLLRAGASVADKDIRGRTPLHNVCQESYAEDVCRTLIAAGSDVTMKDFFGCTPFNIAAEMSNVNTLKVLIEHGAEVNTVDSVGDNPLLNALLFAKNESVQFLLQAGIDYTIVNKQGETILHRAALYGDLQTIEILRSANLAKIDPYTRNHRSKTALQMIEERTTKLEGFTELFQTLLWEISNRGDYLLRVDWSYRVPGAFETNEITEGQAEETVQAEGDGDASEVEDFFDASEQTN